MLVQYAQAPAYIGEMSPASIRGVLVSLKEGMIVVGMLLGYTVGYVFQHQKGGWRNTYSVSVILGICMFVGVYMLPPSARWLALKGRIHEARRYVCAASFLAVHVVALRFQIVTVCDPEPFRR
jgi:MFS family permease